MEDKNQPNDDPSNSGTPGVNDDSGQGGSPKPNDDAGAEGYRKQQSRADKAEAERDELAGRVGTLESIAMGTVRDQFVSDFMKEHGTDYPDVTADDLKQFASDPDDMETVAKTLQKKAEDIKQKALADVREVPDNSMTQAEKDKQLAELKKNPGPRSFGDYLRIASTKVRK